MGTALMFAQVIVALCFSVCFISFTLAQDANSPTALACALANDPAACRDRQKLLTAGPPGDGKITISNNSGETIYKLFAWPTDLSPRTYNILNIPLLNGNETEVTIDNTYNDCNFTFQYDPNDPKKMRNRAALAKKGFKIQNLVNTETNICGGRTFVWLGDVPSGKFQGAP